MSDKDPRSANRTAKITTFIIMIQIKRKLFLLFCMKARYYNAPDLEWVGKNGWRFMNAVSDFATHADPIRKTRNYNENLFLRTAEGNPMIDKAYKMVLAAA